MQRRWVCLWPNMGSRRFSLTVVRSVAAEPNSLDCIYRATVSVLTEWKLEPTSAAEVRDVWLSPGVIFKWSSQFALFKFIAGALLLLFFFVWTLNIITLTPYVRKTKKYVQEECRDTNMLLQVQLLFGWRAITLRPWLISAGRLGPHHGKSDTHVSHVLWWWWQWWWWGGKGGGGGRVLRGSFLSITAPSWRRHTLLWGSTSATPRWRTASCSQGWDLSSPHTWWSRPGGWTQNISNSKQEEDSGL